MARYVLIDAHTGYVFGDTAELAGFARTEGTIVDAARTLDESIGEYGRTYLEVSRHDLDGRTGYHVYRADACNSDAVPTVCDGQDAETIAAVESECEYVGSIHCYCAD
jgi:hypothetical protein